MTLSKAEENLELVNLELASLAGRKDRNTELGRKAHNRCSTLYARRKRLIRIIGDKQ